MVHPLVRTLSAVSAMVAAAVGVVVAIASAVSVKTKVQPLLPH